MNLVQYSSSDSDSDTNSSSPSPHKKRKLPPLPIDIADKFARPPKISEADDPSFYGMSRAIPFKKGFFPTFFFIEWMPSLKQRNKLEEIGKVVNQKLSNQSLHTPEDQKIPDIVSKLNWAPLYKSSLGAHLPLHVSLSETLFFPQAKFEPYLNNLQVMVKSTPMPYTTKHPTKKDKTIPCFKVDFDPKLKCFSNEAGSRYFITLQLTPESKTSNNKILEVLRTNQAIFGHKGEVYNKEKFHISFISAVLPHQSHDPIVEVERINKVLETMDVDVGDLSFHFDAIKALRKRENIPLYFKT